MEKNIRQSNFELMRITSMLFIILWHVIIHGQVYSKGTFLSKIIFEIILAFLSIHVNSYILLTGFFQHKKNIKFSKILKISNSIWFYSFLIIIIFKYFNLASISNLEIFRSILPIPLQEYWFMSSYLILYTISPILNIVINNSDYIKLKKIIILLFLLFSVLPYLTGQRFYNVHGGYYIINFIFLYLTGAYLNKYYIESKKENFKIKSRNALILILIIFYCIFCFSNFLVRRFSSELLYVNSEIIREISNNFYSEFFNYSNPLIICASICYFLIFSNLKISNKLLNKISSLTFGVYLIHDNVYVRNFLYNKIGFNKEIYRIKSLLYIFMISILIFIVCTIIEFLRQKLFKFIYNRKISCKFRKWYRSYIDSLGIHINW